MLTRKLRIGLAQINPTVGDLNGNTGKIIDAIEQANESQVDILAFPELAITGYPPEDLLCRSQFIIDNLACLDRIRLACEGPMVVIVGFVDRSDDTYNAAAILQDRKKVGVYRKSMLPNYGVFDENRYFQRTRNNCVFQLGEISFGVSICEDIWVPAGPAREQALLGDALLLINLSASPYKSGKPRQRLRMLSTRAADNTAVLAFVNQVGGQDELIFDGSSAILNPNGEPIAVGPLFQEDLIFADLELESIFQQRLRDPRRRIEKATLAEEHRRLDIIRLPLDPDRTEKKRPSSCPSVIKIPGREEEIYNALLLGIRDYVNKNDFEKVVIGLSGGVDSSLTTVLAVDALGADRVVTVGMPSRFSSPDTQDDTRKLAEILGVELLWIPIDAIYETYLQTLEKILPPHPLGVTEENIQSRVRGNLLMALSNHYGWLVLATGNKSEISVGYCTLYGDMAGGISVLKDLSKTMVYRLCRYRNRKSDTPVIPDSILERPPSAELKPNQKDTDSLPEYDLLDQILHAYIEEERSFEEILSRTGDEALVRKITRLVDLHEYKRRQSPPGLKISPRALGKDRRLPITNKYRIFDSHDSEPPETSSTLPDDS